MFSQNKMNDFLLFLCEIPGSHDALLWKQVISTKICSSIFYFFASVHISNIMQNIFRKHKLYFNQNCCSKQFLPFYMIMMYFSIRICTSYCNALLSAVCLDLFTIYSPPFPRDCSLLPYKHCTQTDQSSKQVTERWQFSEG